MRRFSELIPDCSARIRVASWSADISRLNKATGAPADFVRLDPLFAGPKEALGGGEGDVGAERALAHAGTAGDDDQVRFVKPADLGVEAVEAGCEARQMAAAVERALGHCDRFLGGFGEALALPSAPPSSATLYNSVSARSI